VWPPAQRQIPITSEKAVNMSPGELQDKIVTGVFVDVGKAESTQQSGKLQLRLKG